MRFVIDDKPLKCDQFRLTAKVGDITLVPGKFVSNLQIPNSAQTLPRNDAVDIRIECGEHRWHFTHVGERAFLRGWWWIGIDYAPFGPAFRYWPELQDAAWVRYLIVEPLEESGFTMFRYCPEALKNAKPGPCFVQ